MIEDKNKPVEACDHDKCVVVSIDLTTEFRANGSGEPGPSMAIGRIHAIDPMEVSLDLMHALYEALINEGDFAMKQFGLPPEVVSLATHHGVAVRVEEE